MATLSDLVEVVAHQEGMDPATVRLIARYVREAGLIETRGRGLSAHQMGYADAANLLIAVNASAIAQEAPESVRKYRRLVWSYDDGAATFGEALDRLIEALATSRTLPQNYLSLPIHSLVSQKPIRDVEVTFHRPHARVQLRITVGEGFGRSLAADEISIHSRELVDLTTRRAKRVGQIYFEFVGRAGEKERLFIHPHGVFYKDGTPYPRPGDRVIPIDRRDTTEIGYQTVDAVACALTGKPRFV